jgi:hypothetical protein
MPKEFTQASGRFTTAILEQSQLSAFMTLEEYNSVPNGDVFKTVTTKIQNVHDPGKSLLKFLCKKSEGDWAIYYDHAHIPDYVIATTGMKVKTKECIQQICPCSPEVLELYRF